MRLKVYLEELRAPFFTASIVPILLGTAMAWYATREFDLLFFIAALIGGVMLHAGANVSNDYFDFKSGCDDMNTEFIRPFTGGSRMIQKGIMTPRAVLIESLVCYLIALGIGVWLIYAKGLTILWLGLIGAISGFFYTAPPFKLVARGIGEIIIAINFGVLMTLGAYFVQTGTLSWDPVIASLPIAILIAGVLYINEFPDYIADKSSGKNHLVARLGREKGVKGYKLIIALAFASIILGVVLKVIPLLGLVSILSIPIAVKGLNVAYKNYNNPKNMAPASAATIQLHLLIGLLLALSYIISGYI